MKQDDIVVVDDADGIVGRSRIDDDYLIDTPGYRVEAAFYEFFFIADD
jgi:hypothetical protein